MQSLLILGRQPALGLAELESLYGATTVQSAGSHAALLDVDSKDIDFSRLGGSTRLARLLTTLDTTDWKEIEKHLMRVSPEHAALLPEGKLTIGISVFGLKVSPAAVNATGLTFKKVIRGSGRSVRLVPNKELELNTAQVLHNKLTSGNGWELLLIRDGNKTHLAQTVAVQDIDSYTIRDRERPKRDARVGMLPPKLAQIIINLAVSNNPPSNDFTVLDPFCGTGVLLQEALLMGYTAEGSDVDQRMIDYTSANLDWLATKYDKVWDVGRGTQTGDATSHIWEESKLIKKGGEVVDAELVPLHIDAVACETYLGRPFTSRPDPETLARTVSEVNTILRKFLKNIAKQIEPGTRLCLAVPAWQTRPNQFKHLPLANRDIDQLAELGYNRISFEHVAARDLLYYRPDQIVARELLVIIKN